MRIVVAVDKFKGSLSAQEAASYIAAGLHSVDPAIEVVTAPVADGGDGTVDAAVAAGFERREVAVCGPTGEAVQALYARQGGTAVVELANSCGIQLLPGGVLAAMTSSSRGLGEVMAAALDDGCTRLVVGVGGSASTDGGAGMLTALGARILTASGEPVAAGGAGLASVHSVDLSGVHPRLVQVRLELASDVDNPLTGEHGAAATYGPQKGASATQVQDLDAALTHFAAVADPALADLAGAGAAGGAGYAALLLGAQLRSGIAVMLEINGFAGRLVGADLVITGEGSLDAQSLRGKAPMGVAQAAHAERIPVVALAGRVVVTAQELHAAHIDTAYALTDIKSDVQACMTNAGPLLERRAADLMTDLRRRTQ
ncbi:MAG: glycerate kinase [Actinomycetota bacterium]|nr:glycerate kinase [Actinomycetota bacterium]